MLNFKLELMLLATAIIGNSALAFWVYRADRKNTLNKIFALLGVTASVWLAANFASIQPQLINYSLLLIRFSIFLAVPVNVLVFLLAHTFPNSELRLHKKVFAALLAISAVVMFLALTPITFSGVNLSPQGPMPVAGPGIALFAIFSFALNGGAVFLLYKKFIKFTGTKKRQVAFVLAGITLMFAAIIFTIFIPAVIAQNNTFVPLLPIYVLMFLGTTAYSIFKHHLFDIRVIATELFTTLVIFIFLINIFLGSDPNEFILDSLLFVLITIFGIMLIRGTIREINTLKELSETKSQFLSIASHQLRTPLAVIKGYLSMLREGSYGKLSEKQLEVINKSFRTNEGMIMLVNDFLNLSRAEKGTLKYNFEKVDLRDMISTIVDEFQMSYSQKDISLNWKKPAEPVIVEIDVDKFRQVVSNLVDNALKYTKEGGVSIRIDVDEKFEKKATIYVSDTGIGIEPGEEDKIFRSFERGDRGEKENVTGAGLGLYVVKMIVEGHNGTIKAESKGIDHGTTFVVKIPLALTLTKNDIKYVQEKDLYEKHNDERER